MFRPTLLILLLTQDRDACAPIDQDSDGRRASSISITCRPRY